MSAVELLALAERCEAASGPNRRLDAEIDWTVRGETGAWYVTSRPGSLFSEVPGWWRDASDRSHKASEFTSSLDAAMSLVPEGWDGALYLAAEGHKPEVQLETPAMRVGFSLDDEMAVGSADTLALALCAAALKARASLSPASTSLPGQMPRVTEAGARREGNK